MFIGLEISDCLAYNAESEKALILIGRKASNNQRFLAQNPHAIRYDHG